MNSYTPSLRDIQFSLEEVANLGSVIESCGFDSVDLELCDNIVAEAGAIAGEVLAPLNRIGDEQGARLENGVVRTPDGWATAWGVLVEGGWNSLPFPAEWGGMGLPNLLNTAVQEMVQAANMALALCPMLTQGAVNALMLYASDDIKEKYLRRLVSGEWTGTMNLTEPQAGSDLAAIRTRAIPAGDGSYKISGQKIFITYGDHDIASNIVHLVLARLPDAPVGAKGVSLFVVPKYLTGVDGIAVKRNDIVCASLEHKLGIHGSPTAVLSFGDTDGAVGWLVGEPHRGLECMFTMMNHARQAVGLQGLAIAERAYQQALSYARERVQGKPAGWRGEGAVAIVHHPEVRRTLMSMKARIEAMRGILYVAAAAHDVRHRHPDAEARREAAALEELLTPIAKGWCTEMGQEIASQGVQIHGGMGYIEETGACQHLRDARITTIYEGTTAIQANDLVFRKVLRDKGAVVTAYLKDVRANAERMTASDCSDLHTVGRELLVGIARTNEIVAAILEAGGDAVRAAAATSLLHAMGLLAGGHYLGIGAQAALRRLAAGEEDDGFLAAKPIIARFFAEHLLGQIEGHRAAATIGTGSVMALQETQL